MMTSSPASRHGVYVVGAGGAAAVTLGVCLGGGAQALQLPLVVAFGMFLLALGAIVPLSTHAERRAVYLVVVGVALASSTFPFAASALVNGRFFLASLLIIIALRSKRHHVPLVGHSRLLLPILTGAAAFSILVSPEPSATVQKVLALAVTGTAAALAARMRTMQQPAFAKGLAWVLAFLVSTNLLFVGHRFGSRVRGWTINPNSLGQLCALALPVLVAVIPSTRGPRRMALVGSCLIALIMLVLSGSRASVVGAVVGVLAVLATLRAVRKRAFVAAAIIVIVFIPAAYSAANDRGALDSVRRNGDSGRSESWTVAWREIERRPIVGAGYATTEARFATEQFGGFARFQGSHFHNAYLETAVEIGFPAALLLVAAGVSALMVLARPPPRQLAWAAGVASAGASIAIFETGLLTPGAIVFFPFWLAFSALVEAGPARVEVSPDAIRSSTSARP